MARFRLVQMLLCGQAVFHVTIVPAAVQISCMCDNGGNKFRSYGTDAVSTGKYITTFGGAYSCPHF